ncbi:hypothetical protein [Flexibacterium corallicola]|uniref:hypothetical protein n=1 Tax=Flexibacterium corallicola TaxID=3037259 RepID=UPI00286F2023|nr:hypothetical protein [Pseudovibrio sp. M1P-2-3]
MPLYQTDPLQGTTNMTISQLIQRAGTGNPGPTPVINPNPNPNYLWVNQFGQQTLDATQNPTATAAIGLITCASVIMVSTNPNDAPQASVYHANAGVVSANDMNQLRLGISGNPNALPAWNDLLVVYAVAGAWDAGYTGEINTIVGLGIPAGQVTWLERVPAGVFGINSLGQVGSPGIVG